MRPKRILHVTNAGFKPKHVYLNGTGHKLTNGWIRAGHHVISFSDRDVARWTGFGYRRWGARATNAILLDAAQSMRPDVIALGHADVIEPETLHRIRQKVPGIKVLQWNVDSLFEGNEASSEDNRQRLLAKIEVVDATFVTTPGRPLAPFAKSGRIAAFMPNPCDPSVERGRNFEREDLAADLFFVSGTGDQTRFHCGVARHLDTLCQTLQNRLPEVRFSFHGVLGKPHLFGPAFEDTITSCRMGLNLSRRNDLYLYSSDRIAQLAGNGLLVLIDRASGFGDLFGEEELGFYSTEEELIDKIGWFKKDDALARRIAENGWRRYHMLFDSRIVGQYMLDVLLGEHDPKRHPWPSIYPG